MNEDISVRLVDAWKRRLADESVDMPLLLRAATELREIRALADELWLHLDALATVQYDRRYEPDYPCGGCYEAIAAYREKFPDVKRAPDAIAAERDRLARMVSES